MRTFIRALPRAFRWRLFTFIAIYVVVSVYVLRLALHFTAPSASGRELAWTAVVAVVGTALLIAGLLLPYNIAALRYRPPTRTPLVSVRVQDTWPLPSPSSDFKFRRIGIILSGGGAKGAYQAGALRAVHEFLEKHKALDRVKMIAGTSIGSWNAMFWLGGLLSPGPDGRSAHERWWSEISLDRIATFGTYRPGQPWLFKTTPWEQTFMQLFRDNADVHKRLTAIFTKNPPVHFYFTRTNVARGTMEFSTNRAARVLTTVRRVAGAGGPMVPIDMIDVIETADFDHLRKAVFASMDLPPLFPFASVGPNADTPYEDGGVIANLPVWFGTHLEQCDLLFILALNASFAESQTSRFMASRLVRALDIRQGVLEYDALRGIYDRNELIAMAKELSRAKGLSPIAAVAVCPGPPLAINTTDFWAADRASRAFHVMYQGTKSLLDSRFYELADPARVVLACISPQQELSLRPIV